MTTKIHYWSSIWPSVLCLIAAEKMQGQGTTYISNLGNSYGTPGGVVGGEFTLAQGFETGTNAGAYILDSVQLLLDINGSGGGNLSVSIYNNNSTGLPGTSLDTLSGPNPTGPGTYTYSSSGVVLNPSEFYWIVATSGARSYQWYYSGQTYVSSDGWGLGGEAISNDAGNTWTVPSGVSPTYLFAINASTTAAPEPKTYELVGLALAAIFFRPKIIQAKPH